MFAILAFGDSITQGRGENPSLSWVGRLKNDFEKKDFYNSVYNLGVPGDTSHDLIERFHTEAKARIRYIHPGDKYVILIAIGTNDAVAFNNPENLNIKQKEFSENISKLISMAKELTPDVMLLGLLPVDESLTNPYEGTFLTNARQKEYENIIKKECEKTNTNFIPLFEEFEKLDYKELLADGLHPNSKGYDLMYAIIKKELGKLNVLN